MPRVPARAGILPGQSESIYANLNEADERPLLVPADIPFRLLGFGVTMGWVLLVVYSLLSPETSSLRLDVLFRRQLGFNLSLGLCLLAIAGIGSWMKISAYRLRVSVIAGSGLAFVGTWLAVIASQRDMLLLQDVSAAFMGFGGGLLLLLWLHLYSETSVNYAGRYLAASMILTAAIVFFGRNLTYGLSVFVTVCLPLISGGMLLYSWSRMEIRQPALAGRGTPDVEGSRRPFLRVTFQLLVYAFVLGVLQGSVTADGAALLRLFNPASVLGVGIAGALVLLFHSRVSRRGMIVGLARRIALVLFVGALSAIPFVGGLANTVLATIILVAYILIDISVLIFMVDLARTFDLNSLRVIGLYRGMYYVTVSIGVGVGFYLMNAEGAPLLPTSVLCSCLAFALVATSSFASPSDEHIWVAEHYLPIPASSVFGGRPSESVDDGNDDSLGHLGPWRKKCIVAAHRWGLSPRESEVFLLLAKGRNAEYVQNALHISAHTAKTHIANIYRKAEIHSAQELLDLVESSSEFMSELSDQSSPT
ncbi:MAG: response regulator transcription factor [Coriobacteriia bacterium]